MGAALGSSVGLQREIISLILLMMMGIGSICESLLSYRIDAGDLSRTHWSVSGHGRSVALAEKMFTASTVPSNSVPLKR